MTRGTMRTLLRRRLNEVTVDNWQDEDLNEVLNLGTHKVQKRILIIDPEAFIYFARVPVTANEEFIAKPQGFWYEKSVRLLDSSTGKYAPIERMDYYLAEELAAGSETVYSHVGRYLALRPIPETTVSAGLELLYVPTLEMAADSDVSPIHLGLHDAVVKAAQLLLLPETGEPYKDLKEALEEDLGDIHLYYRMSAGPSPQLNPVVPKDY